MVGATALVWVPATLLTPAVDRATLTRFYARVRPPGAWGPIRAGVADARRETWMPALGQWIIGTTALLATTIGPLQLLVGSRRIGTFWCAIAALGWGGLWRWTSRLARTPSVAPVELETPAPSAIPAGAGRSSG